MKKSIELKLRNMADEAASWGHTSQPDNVRDNVFHEVNCYMQELLRNTVAKRQSALLSRELEESDVLVQAMNLLNWYPCPVAPTDEELQTRFEDKYLEAIKIMKAAVVPNEIKAFHEQSAQFIEDAYITAALQFNESFALRAEGF